MGAQIQLFLLLHRNLYTVKENWRFFFAKVGIQRPIAKSIFFIRLFAIYFLLVLENKHPFIKEEKISQKNLILENSLGEEIFSLWRRKGHTLDDPALVEMADAPTLAYDRAEPVPLDVLEWPPSFAQRGMGRNFLNNKRLKTTLFANSLQFPTCEKKRRKEINSTHKILFICSGNISWQYIYWLK